MKKIKISKKRKSQILTYNFNLFIISKKHLPKKITKRSKKFCLLLNLILNSINNLSKKLSLLENPPDLKLPITSVLFVEVPFILFLTINR